MFLLVVGHNLPCTPRYAVKHTNASVTSIDNRSIGMFNREAREGSQELEYAQRDQRGKQRASALHVQGDAGYTP